MTLPKTKELSCSPLPLSCVMFELCNGTTITSSVNETSTGKLSEESYAWVRRTAQPTGLVRLLFLPENGLDPCLKKGPLLARQDCLQQVLEAYYGPDFSYTCHGLSLKLAYLNCEGCPWDRINPDILSQMNNSEFTPKLSNRTSIALCRHVALLIMSRRTRVTKEFSHRSSRLVLLSRFCSSFYQFFSLLSGAEDGVVEPVKLLGCDVPEPIALAAFWMTYYVASFYLFSLMIITHTVNLGREIYLTISSWQQHMEQQ